MERGYDLDKMNAKGTFNHSSLQIIKASELVEPTGWFPGRQYYVVIEGLRIGVKAEHELTRGSPGSVPAGILAPKIHTWIRAGMFPRITWIRRSNTCGFAGTCHSAGWHRYLQVYPQVNIFFTV